MGQTILISGGAGFIGVNSARYFADRGWDVSILDNLSRQGTEGNLRWLQDHVQFRFERADVRNSAAVDRVVGAVRPDFLLHLAGQVAVGASVADPRVDFEVNTLGTFNVLEAIRRRSPESFLVDASTNKVYGRMDRVRVVERAERYDFRDLPDGVDETQPLEFHSPYGCSKGAADQYVLDYARIYGMHTAAFRQSCIYGTRQLGNGDQGWVTWFTIAAVLGKPITIYGDGKQVRDLLHVQDLARAYEAAYEHRGAIAGLAFNIGGGLANALSLRELLAYLESELGITIPLEWSDWRPGDQRVFVCNVGKAQRLLGWRPTIGVRTGVRQLVDWVRDNKSLFA